jgi:hypothetical protein
MAKVKLSLKGLSPDQRIAKANIIKAALTGNASFPAPNPSVATLGSLIATASAAVAAYNALVVQAQAALAVRDSALAALCAGLTQEGAYVESASGGDVVKIESAGMSVRRARSRVGVSQVLNLVLREGAYDGTLRASWNPDPGAKSFEIQISLEPVTATSWAIKMTASKSSATLSGLTSGAKLWVRVRSIGAGNSTGPWSDPATKTVP